LYLERPAAQRRAAARSWMGRFGYNDLKEAALTEAYVLCIGLKGCSGAWKRLS
jgi:hypothetical protein